MKLTQIRECPRCGKTIPRCGGLFRCNTCGSFGQHIPDREEKLISEEEAKSFKYSREGRAIAVDVGIKKHLSFKGFDRDQ